MKTTPNHNEEERKRADDQKALFDLIEHDNPPDLLVPEIYSNNSFLSSGDYRFGSFTANSIMME